MKVALALLVLLLALSRAPALGGGSLLSPGLYRGPTGNLMYVGVEHELPDAAVNEYFDPKTGRFYDSYKGPLELVGALQQERRIVNAPEGALGASLWYGGPGARPTVILIHGNDPETREMGFLIPFFVANGVNVVTYDQRGTGQSAGNWFLNGPPDRARDVDAVYDAFSRDSHVTARRIGVWAFSNGGWTAPIVATQRPIAFMVLKSAPAETLEANIMYEVKEQMARHHFGAAATADAQETWRTLIAALNGRTSLETARRAYAAAAHHPWFGASILPDLHFPLPATMVGGLRRLVTYDPGPTLALVRTPTLALFGARDRNVDVSHATVAFPEAFKKAGMTDFTMHEYPDAGHSLKVSATGYNGDVEAPERFVNGYPQIMLSWLRQRGFAAAVGTLSPERRSPGVRQ